MENDRKILACVDQSDNAPAVAAAGAWASSRTGADLELLHILDRHAEIAGGGDHSGAIGMDAQETLLARLSAEEQVLTKSVRDHGRFFLNNLREQALAAGAAMVDSRLRYGDLEETLASRQADTRLLVIGRRGEAAQRSGRSMGGNVERVVRAMKRPILAVSGVFAAPRRVVFAFDGGTTARRGVGWLANDALFASLPVHLVMSGAPGRDGLRRIERAAAALNAAAMPATFETADEPAAAAVSRICAGDSSDLVVMGAYSHAPLLRWLRGSKTSELLSRVPGSAILLR